MGFGAQRSGSTQSSNSFAVVPKDLRGVRSDLGAFFQNQLRTLGGDFGTTPQGFIGQAYKALFDKDPTTDFLGASNALRGVLGGNAFSNAFEQAMAALEPSVRRQIEQLNTGVLNRSAGLGTRFSSDVMNQQRRGAQELMLGQQAQAAQLANQLTGQQLQGGLGVLGLTQQGALDQLARQLPLLVQYAMGFAPVGRSSQGSSSTSGFNVNIPLKPR